MLGRVAAMLLMYGEMMYDSKGKERIDFVVTPRRREVLAEVLYAG